MPRQRLPEARIGYFHHIPFPSSEIFRTLPHREELLPILRQRFRSRRAAEWVAELGAAGVPCGLVNDVAQAELILEPRVFGDERGFAN